MKNDESTAADDVNKTDTKTNDKNSNKSDNKSDNGEIELPIIPID